MHRLLPSLAAFGRSGVQVEKLLNKDGQDRQDKKSRAFGPALSILTILSILVRKPFLNARTPVLCLPPTFKLGAEGRLRQDLAVDELGRGRGLAAGAGEEGPAGGLTVAQRALV